jgi:hypothetical protein
LALAFAFAFSFGETQREHEGRPRGERENGFPEPSKQKYARYMCEQLIFYFIFYGISSPMRVVVVAGAVAHLASSSSSSSSSMLVLAGLPTRVQHFHRQSGSHWQLGALDPSNALCSAFTMGLCTMGLGSLWAVS